MSESRLRISSIVLSMAVAIALSGCGGGGGPTTSMSDDGSMMPPVVNGETEGSFPLPSGHGLAAGEITVAPGASDEHGNVVVSCPAGGGACVVTVAADGTAVYDRTGGIPTFVPLYEPWGLPLGHGLAAGEITVAPGASDEHGNVVVSCPAGGGACVVTLAADDTAAYDRTGGIPTIMVAVDTRTPPEELPEIPSQQPIHAAQSPIIDLQGVLHIGADVAPPAGELAAGGTHNGIAVSYGSARDGVGADRVLEFFETHVGGGPSKAGEGFTFERGVTGLATFPDRPTIRLAEGTSDEFAAYAVRAVQFINAALPYEKRIVFSSDPAPPLAAIEDIPDGEIYIDFVPFVDWNAPNKELSRPGAEAIAQYDDVLEFNMQTQRWESKSQRAGHVWFDPERTSGESKESKFSTVLHEILHVLGFLGHNNSVRFPDSIMRDNYLLITKQIPPIDREALLAAYSRFEPGTSPEELTAENLGPWTDTSFHIRGGFDTRNGSVAFGVAMRNGLAQPWAFGPTPWTDLADNQMLSETVTWSGRLLGLTPAVEPVGGDADLGVNLGTLDGQLDFTDLEHWGANAAPGEIGTGTTWNDGDLGYSIGVRGNTFVQTGGDDGIVTGAFLGARHEAMGGTLQRSDLTAGFGGAR